MKEIIDYLDELFPDAHCELNYSKDYELLIATMLSAQTTDKRVNKVTSILFNKYKTLNELANAKLDDVKAIVRELGNYNKKASNVIEIAKRLINDKDGMLPCDREYLESLPGVGRKTTNVVLSNIFNKQVIAVDTHVARVSYRLGICKIKDTPYQIEMKLNKKFKEVDLSKLHHQLIFFGRYKCKAIKPICDDCKLKNICRRKEN